MESVTIVGPGRVGGALSLALSSAGFTVDSLIYHKHNDASSLARRISPHPSVSSLNDIAEIDSGIIFITTPDPAIGLVAANLADKISGRPFVFHTSGSLSSEILEPLALKGCRTGSIHPLVSISTPELGVKGFRDAYFCVEGVLVAVRKARKIVRELGGNPFTIDTSQKTLYHAAAVMAAGHLVALVDTAISMMTRTGLSRRDSRRILLPLIRSSVDNLSALDTKNALTGPFARADEEALERQIKSLEAKVAKDEFTIYLDLALRSLDLAEARGANQAAITKMRQMILLAKRKLK